MNSGEREQGGLSNQMESQLASSQHNPASEEMLLKVLTLNCWYVVYVRNHSFLRHKCYFRGLRFISRQRQARIKAIAQHIQEQNYDIVFLQEVLFFGTFSNFLLKGHKIVMVSGRL